MTSSKVLLLGVTFKENCPDIRNSKVFDIIEHLTKEGMEVEAFDPFANAEEVWLKHKVHLITKLETYDGIVLAVAHDFFKALDYTQLKRNTNSIIFDTKAFLDKNMVDARL